MELVSDGHLTVLLCGNLCHANIRRCPCLVSKYNEIRRDAACYIAIISAAISSGNKDIIDTAIFAAKSTIMVGHLVAERSYLRAKYDRIEHANMRAIRAYFSRPADAEDIAVTLDENCNALFNQQLDYTVAITVAAYIANHIPVDTARPTYCEEVVQYAHFINTQIQSPLPHKSHYHVRFPNYASLALFHNSIPSPHIYRPNRRQLENDDDSDARRKFVAVSIS